MHSSRLLIALLVLPLAACGSREIKETKETVIQPPVRETVVEQPVIRETIVQPPVVKETIVERQAPRVCSYGGSLYQSGSVSCQGGYHYYCSNGAWDSMSSRC